MKPTKIKQSEKGKQNLVDSQHGTTRVQELQLELIELVNQNKCKGKKVAALLRENRSLWRAALMPCRRLDPLLDMENGEWSADTLYVLPADGQEEELEKLAKRFNGDEMKWLDGKESLSLLGFWNKDIVKNAKLILWVWWD